MNPENSTLTVPRSEPGIERLLNATPRGARLARQLAVRFLAAHGWPPTCDAGRSAAVVVAELAANAVTHGRLPGRGFRLALAVGPAGTLRVEVTDPRGDRRPVPRASAITDGSGRGLLLVAALADAWGVVPYPPSGKTVWARLALNGVGTCTG